MDYFSHPAMSQSKLKDLKQSPKHFWTKHLSPERIIEEPTEAMQFGTLVHTCLFEHKKFLNNYIVMPKFDKRTKDGKAAHLDFVAKNADKICIDEVDYNSAIAIRKAIFNKKTSSVLFSNSGLIEKELYWIDEITNIECKAKLDYFIEPCVKFPNGFIIDLKTTTNAYPEEFARSIYKYGYYNQLAFYCEGVRQIYKTQNYPDFIFTVIEKSQPYECSFLVGDENMFKIGLKENYKLLELYKHCVETNNWYGYEDKIQTIALPAWAANKFFFEEQA